MKKRILSLAFILILCFSIYTAALAITRQAGGSCYMKNTGRSVSFSGYSESAQTEDSIGITVILWEKKRDYMARGSESFQQAERCRFCSRIRE